MSITLLPNDIRENYEVHEWKHACAILSSDFPDEWNDIIQVLSEFRLYKSQMLAPGGGKSPISKAIDSAFYARNVLYTVLQKQYLELLC